MRYKIHEVAKMLGISPQTLRFYEQYGILTHERTGKGQYRQYSDMSMDLLMSLRKCRNCGFTVAQTAELLRSTGSAQISGALKTRAQALEQQAEMQLRIAAVLRSTAGLTESIEARGQRLEERERPKAYAMIVKRAGAERPEPKAMERVGAWAEWMPLVKWMIRYRPDDLMAGEQPDMGFVVDEENAAFLGVTDMPGLEYMPPCKCLYTILRWRTGPGTAGVLSCMREVLSRMTERGQQLAGAPLVNTLWNTGVDGEPFSWGEFWFPI